MKTTRRLRSAGLVLLGVAGWLIASVLSWPLASGAFFWPLFYLWYGNIFLVPVVIGVAAAWAGWNSQTERFRLGSLVDVLRAAIASICLLVAYVWCAALIGHLSGLWWEHVKFGGARIALGASTAILAGTIAFAAAVVSFLVLRWSRSAPVSAALGRAAFALVAAGAFVLVGVAPYADWRA